MGFCHCAVPLYLILVMPVVLAFSIDSEFTTVMAKIIDIFFLTDLILNFFTTFENEFKQLEVQFSAIAWNYLNTWFLIDFLSSLPLEDMGISMLGGKSHEDGVRALKILKLVRLMRVFRLGRLIAKAQERFQIKHGTIQIFTFLVSILLFSHWLGTIFYFFSNLEGIRPADSPTWSEQYLGPGESSNWDKYVVCIYWSLTTMTTIGYGDVIPKNTTERILATFAMVIGACTFAYGLSTVCQLIFNRNMTKVRFESEMDKMVEFLNRYEVSQHLGQKITKYLWYRHVSSCIEDFEDTEDEVLDFLSPALRSEVVQELGAHYLQSIPARNLSPLFCCFSTTFRRDLVATLKGEARCPNELVVRGIPSCWHEKYQDHQVWLLAKGRVHAVLDNGATRIELDTGATWGEQGAILQRQRSTHDIYTSEFSDLFRVPAAVFQQVVCHYPLVHQKLLEFYEDRQYDWVTASEMQAWREVLEDEMGLKDMTQEGFAKVDLRGSDGTTGSIKIDQNWRESAAKSAELARGLSMLTPVGPMDVSLSDAPNGNGTQSPRKRDAILEEIVALQDRLLELKDELTLCDSYASVGHALNVHRLCKSVC